MRSKRTLLALLVLILTLSGCQLWWPWAKKTDMTRTSPDGLYQQAVEYYQDGSYKKAIDLFQRVKEEYPLSQYALSAELGMADAYFSAKEYPEADLSYSEFISLHPTNENLPYAMYQIGMAHYNQIDTIDRDQTESFKALKAFEQLAARFPNSRFALQAEKMIRETKKILGEQEFYVGEFYLTNKKYQAALRRFERIVRDYANVGLDYKANQYIIETKRRIAEEEAKKKK
ncbi:MAG: outer membrane protein assembly factor BamD [Deltaproteobacteria bacterium]|nr:outer membrane protein assembly factor BamD [Deltaproteobacteria bacterium]